MLAAAILGSLAVLAGAAYLVAWRAENRPDRILGLLYHRLVSEE